MEQLLSTIAYLLEFLVSSKGLEFEKLVDHVSRDNWEVVRKPPKTQEEIDKEAHAKHLEFFRRLSKMSGQARRS